MVSVRGRGAQMGHCARGREYIREGLKEQVTSESRVSEIWVFRPRQW